MTKPKTPTERLDAFSKWVFDEGGANDRLDQLERAMIATVETNADTLSYQLAELVDGHDGQAEDYAREQASKATSGEAVVSLGKYIFELEAPVFLSVSSDVTDKGKAMYGNEKSRAAAVLVTLADTDHADSEQHAKLKADLQSARQAEAMARARIASIESEEKTWGRKVDALRSRLDNLTARAGRR